MELFESVVRFLASDQFLIVQLLAMLALMSVWAAHYTKKKIWVAVSVLYTIWAVVRLILSFS